MISNFVVTLCRYMSVLYALLISLTVYSSVVPCHFFTTHPLTFFPDCSLLRRQGLERCAGEVVTDMLTIIEEFDPEEAQMRLVMRELPTFADYFRQLSDADPAFARQCMMHWKTFLVGPPNRPNEVELIHNPTQLLILPYNVCWYTVVVKASG